MKQKHKRIAADVFYRVHVYNAHCQTIRFFNKHRIRLNVVASYFERLSTDSEFQTQGALTRQALADNANAMRGITDTISTYGEVCI